MKSQKNTPINKIFVVVWDHKRKHPFITSGEYVNTPRRFTIKGVFDDFQRANEYAESL